MYKLTKDDCLLRIADGAIIPADKNNADYQAYCEWIREGNSPELHSISVEETIAEYEASLDSHMDAVAKSHRYDSRYTFALRAAFDGPYHEEGKAFAIWMDSCNFHALEILNKCLSGAIEIPTLQEFIADLPKFILPK